MIIQRVVHRPTTFLILFVLLVGFGLYSASDLAIDLYPEISPPVLLIFTDYPGAGPEEVEKTVTRPMEGVLSNVARVETIRSVSSEGSSQITMEFTWGVDMAEASNDVRDKLEFVKDFLPPDSSTPQIFKFDPSAIPILFLMVRGNRPPEELRGIADKFVVPRIEQVDGVALAGIAGGSERTIMVEIPQNRLEAYGLTLTQVAGTLRSQNVQISAGSITEGSKDFLVRTTGEYRSIDEIKNTVVVPDREIRLRDLANVYDGYRDPSTTVYINGEPGVYVTVQKQSGTNSVRTADKVKERIPRINDVLPRGVSVEVIEDTTNIIRSSLAQVSSSAAMGGLLAVVILFVFLRSVKATLIIGLSIPVSIIVTLMLMYFANLTLNLMTITGLALGIGMLVDNSIVILENIYRYREKGAKLRTAAVLGGQEMLTAITASTLTTIVVFAPLALFKSQLGFMGEMFSSLSFTVVISLASSLAVAVLLVPVLASRYLPVSSRREEPLRGVRRRMDDALGNLFGGLDEAYKGGLRVVLKHRLLTLVVVFALLIGSFFLVPLRGFELLPNFQTDTVEMTVDLPVGTKLEVTEALLRQMETVIKDEVHGYEDIIISAGERSFFGFLGAALGHRGSITVTLPPFEQRIDDSEAVKAKVRKHFNDFPSAVFAFRQGGGPRSASPVDLIIRSNDLDKGKATAERIRELLKKEIPGVTEPSLDLKDGLPEVEIHIDRNKAYDFGLNVAAVGAEIKANIDGVTASKYRVGGDEYDILVILDRADRDAIPDLDRVFVSSPSGARIPLASFASYERTSGPVNINREQQARTIRVTAGVVPGTDLRSTEERIREAVAREIPADEDVVIEYSGDYADLQKYGFRLVLVFLIAVALVFGIMASQFESLLDPFIILFTIPLTLLGVILIHVALEINFTIFTIVGLVVLAGVVVNNGIVLVDYTNLLRRRGAPLFDAVVASGGNRLRPILMTTLTTVLGLLPLAFDRGEGLDLIRPIGVTILGGLAVSTVFTLFLIPVLYSIFNELGDRRRVKTEARRQRHLESRKRFAAAGAVES